MNKTSPVWESMQRIFGRPKRTLNRPASVLRIERLRGAAQCQASIERLEARIAPAVLLNARTLRYTDPDGDLVTVSISRGSFDPTADFTFVSSGRGEQLQRISLGDDGAEFAGASLVISAQRRGLGDGIVHVGYIDARGLDLASVRISGDLGRIDAGDADFATPGIGFLKTRSLGKLGLSTQATGDANLASHIAGDLTALRVSEDIVAASISVGGGAGGLSAKIGSATIGGSLRGGGALDSGSIHSSGGIGFLDILGSIIGGAGQNSGSVSTDGQLGSILVAGSVKSGAGAGSGSIRAGEAIGSVFVRGSLAGTAERSVVISAGGATPMNGSGDALCLSQLRVGGNVTFAEILGGYDLTAEPVNGDAQIGRLVVGGDWVASTAVAGAIPGPDGLFGTGDDAAAVPDQSSIQSSIRTIVIAGRIRGTSQHTSDHFGFVAGRIGSVISEGKSAVLLPGANNDTDPATARLALGTTGDFRILELPPPPPPPSLVSAISRKEHGAAGAFDITLGVSGPAGVESRAGDTLTLIFTFDHDLASGSVAIASGTGTITAPPVFNGKQMMVSLGSVADQQTLVIQLFNVTDSAGGVLTTGSIPIAILVADVNANRVVNTSDVNIVRAAAGGTIDLATFRTDIDHNGVVDQADVDVARDHSGHQVP